MRTQKENVRSDLDPGNLLIIIYTFAVFCALLIGTISHTKISSALESPLNESVLTLASLEPQAPLIR